jgi:hypothetical protein
MKKPKDQRADLRHHRESRDAREIERRERRGSEEREREHREGAARLRNRRDTVPGGIHYCKGCVVCMRAKSVHSGQVIDRILLVQIKQLRVEEGFR